MDNKKIISNILENINASDVDSLIKIMTILSPKLLHDCVHKALKNKYYYKKLIGSGLKGTVDQVCKGIDCSYALKYVGSYKSKTSEGEIAEIAGNLGIGPHVYDYGFCKELTGKPVNWILMHRIKGKTLSQSYPYKPEIITASLDKYYELTKHDIYQKDLKGDNIMIGDDGNIYIIDYDLAMMIKNPPEKDKNDHLVKMAAILINSLTTMADQYSFSLYSWEFDDTISRNKVYREIYEAAYKWLTVNTNASDSFKLYTYWDEDKFFDEEDDVMDNWIKNIK